MQIIVTENRSVLSVDEGNEGWEEQETGFTKEHMDICGYAYVHSDFGDSFMGVYTCQLTKD